MGGGRGALLWGEKGVMRRSGKDGDVGRRELLTAQWEDGEVFRISLFETQNSANTFGKSPETCEFFLEIFKIHRLVWILLWIFGCFECVLSMLCFY